MSEPVMVEVLHQEYVLLCYVTCGCEKIGLRNILAPSRMHRTVLWLRWELGELWIRCAECAFPLCSCSSSIEAMHHIHWHQQPRLAEIKEGDSWRTNLQQGQDWSNNVSEVGSKKCEAGKRERQETREKSDGKVNNTHGLRISRKRRKLAKQKIDKCIMRVTSPLQHSVPRLFQEGTHGHTKKEATLCSGLKLLSIVVDIILGPECKCLRCYFLGALTYLWRYTYTQSLVSFCKCKGKTNMC